MIMYDKDKNSKKDSKDIPFEGSNPEDFDIDPNWNKNENKESKNKKKKLLNPVIKSFIYLKNTLVKIYENLMVWLIILFIVIAIISVLSFYGYEIGYSLLDLGYWRNFVILLISIIIFWLYLKYFLNLIKGFRNGDKSEVKNTKGFFLYIVPILVFVIAVSIGFNNALNNDAYETNKERLEREELELEEQEAARLIAIEEQEKQKIKDLEKFGETLIFEESWSHLYNICALQSYNFATVRYLSSKNISYTEYRNFLEFKNIDTFDNKHIYNFDKEIEEYCINNFSYNPIEKDLWRYSARWLNEILDINSWISSTKKMCEKYPNECEDNKKGLINFEYEKYLLMPAFKIHTNASEYLCYLHSNDIYDHKDYFEDTIYLGKSGTSNTSWLNLISDYETEDDERVVEDYFHPVGNQYFESSVIFPKPGLDPQQEFVYDEEGNEVFDSEFYYLNPLENYSLRNSIATEPIHFWNCLFNSTLDNPSPANGQWVINGFGPPIIRGALNPFLSEIGENLSWRMWSITKPGPNSIVDEYEISEIFWFNKIEPVVDFCRNYNLSPEYLQAKKDSEKSGPLELSWGFVELINIDFVNSEFCERHLRFYFEY
jgi:hypothetical protein